MNAALDVPDQTETSAEPWTPDRVKDTVEAHVAERGALRFDPEARNPRHTHIEITPDGARWRVQQMLIDAEMVNDWVAEFDVDVEGSRTRQRPVLSLLRIAPLT